MRSDKVTVIGVRRCPQTAAYKLLELHLKWRVGTKIPPRFGTACPHRLLGRQPGSWAAMSYYRRFLRITAGTSIFPGKAKKIKENGKSIFCKKKSETPFGNVVFQGKMHMCAKYGNFMMKYARRMATTKGICTENLECSYMVSLFVKVFFQNLSKFKFIIFHNK